MVNGFFCPHGNEKSIPEWKSIHKTKRLAYQMNIAKNYSNDVRTRSSNGSLLDRRLEKKFTTNPIVLINIHNRIDIIYLNAKGELED